MQFGYAEEPGTLKWKFEIDSEVEVESSPAISSDGTIYVGSDDGYLYAINPDGTLKWKFKTENWGTAQSSSPAIGSNGTIYVVSKVYPLYLYAINLDGTLKWKFQIEDGAYSSPAIGSDGTIYAASYDGYLYAINSDSSGLADSPWPMFHHDVMHTGRTGTISINPTNSTTLLFSLNEGWNLKGTSYTISISSFNKPEVVAVWKWAGNSWQFWSPDPSLMEIAQTYELEPITKINAYEGFWIKTTAQVGISVPIGETQ